ncbi:NTP pyrophosphohydrolase [Microbacterium mangrovi]|uniref:NTP pyrophosphohydrolase n=1 Tax=Microbacterium mangrovi TaxID=1348253 RepID=A0A0B2A6F3_9MICO|nr:NUDIX domain-containing protein [Microbacterium mangrovi]KHK99119.1 NTP pyrophosphohydrolase [Microbacterium mangrovi]
MTIEPPEFTRRPHPGPMDPGDAWVVAPSGERYWGRYGAAGLLLIDAERRILMQHRVEWSHFGGTWALPGGARHEGETARDAALREAGEEAGVPADAAAVRAMHIFDLGYWSYATVIADVRYPFEPRVTDPESNALEWVAVDAVDDLPLHPGFAASWGEIRTLLDEHPVIVVDAANVVGSQPDGWWNDRAAAADRLVARIRPHVQRGMDAAFLRLGGNVWFPEWVLVLEGAARTARPVAGIEFVMAQGRSGDDELVAEVARLLGADHAATVVTSDRELRRRVEVLGAHVRGAGALLDQL